MANHPNRNWRKKTQETLASFRQDRCLTMEQAAALFGMNHRSEWHFYESCKRRPDSLLLFLVERGKPLPAFEIPEEHSAYLKEWRKSRNLTQKEAAGMVGKPLATWKKWESPPSAARYTKPTRWLWPALAIISG